MEKEFTGTLKIKPRFYVDKECNWFQDGKPITHQRIYKYNYENLKYKDGLFFIQEGKSRAYIYFEDKPFIIKSVTYIQSKILITLNDFTEEVLDLESLYFMENIPYCLVKNKEFEAKFSRPALYQLSKEIKENNGNFFLFDKSIDFRYP